MVKSLRQINLVKRQLLSQEQQSTEVQRIVRRKFYKEKPRHEKFRKIISSIKKCIAFVVKDQNIVKKIYSKLKTNQNGDPIRQKYNFQKIRELLNQIHIVGKLNQFWQNFTSPLMINWIMKNKKTSYNNIINMLDIQQFINNFKNEIQSEPQKFVNNCLKPCNIFKGGEEYDY